MNYRINLYETFDSNGITIINLFVEIEKQEYNSVHRYVDNAFRYIIIARCFIEIGMMIMMREVK
jgi:hypothetical protein